MGLLLLGLALLLGSAIAAVLLSPAERLSGIVGAAGAVVGCLVGLVPAVRVLLGGELPVLRFAWNVSYGSISIGLDPLSAFFLVPLFVLGGLAAVYGREYLGAYRGVYEPFFDRWGARFYRLRWLQQGLLHVYLMYILTMVVLGLAWTAFRSGIGS